MTETPLYSILVEVPFANGKQSALFVVGQGDIGAAVLRAAEEQGLGNGTLAQREYAGRQMPAYAIVAPHTGPFLDGQHRSTLVEAIKRYVPDGSAVYLGQISNLSH